MLTLFLKTIIFRVAMRSTWLLLSEELLAVFLTSLATAYAPVCMKEEKGSAVSGEFLKRPLRVSVYHFEYPRLGCTRLA